MAKTERPNPIRITTAEGETYTLDFDRASVKFAEQRGFNVLEYKNQPETGVASFFFYAFRKNHKNVARDKTDAILDELGGLLPKELERLEELYTASITSLNVEGERKNSRATVEL